MDGGPRGYYAMDVALVHHRGFGHHADACAEGIVAVLEPIRDRGGTVLELGCGSGALTRHLAAAGHRLIASDASPAMLAITREVVPDVGDLRRLVLPDDPLPAADAIVSVGHALSYLPDEAAIQRGLVAIAEALRPGGILAIDLCDLRWAEARRDQSTRGMVGEDWAIITAASIPQPNRYVRDMTTFVRNDDGTWRRGHERHDTVLVDTAEVPRLLAQHGVHASVHTTLGSSVLPDGLVAIIGERRA